MIRDMFFRPPAGILGFEHRAVWSWGNYTVLRMSKERYTNCACQIFFCLNVVLVKNKKLLLESRGGGSHIRVVG